ncbi:hydrolase [Streptomyces sp. SB3404]|uniref:Hydrolase n=1 Tax=Streptomyces boncukensis TaxID=2711219 RepID=A0A6G4X0T1_9ACTN|nr:hydrolase [Streptomyces boncukensis]NGO70354.1 hydrolase [Streptomyces boncukensis]
MVATAAKHAPAADAGRWLSPDVVEGLREAGFARHFVPAGQGGAAGGFAALGEALETVAESCLSAAWCGMIYATSGRMAAYLPAEGRAEVWAEGPDTLIAAGLVPVRGAEAVPGGWRLTGQWRPLSGVHAADWVLLCAPAPVADSAPRLCFFAVPAHEIHIHDTWNPVGMRGTGSHAASVDCVFVPAHRTFAHAALFAGAIDTRDAMDGADTAPCHAVPMLGAAPPLFAAPAVGAARGALRDWSALCRGRGTRDSADLAADLAFARAAAETDAAGLLLGRGLTTLDSAPVDEAAAARTARDATIAAEGAVRAVDTLFRTAGSAAQDSGSALQRAWRDVHCATSHAALRFERTGAAWAQQVPATALGRSAA